MEKSWVVCCGCSPKQRASGHPPQRPGDLEEYSELESPRRSHSLTPCSRGQKRVVWSEWYFPHEHRSCMAPCGRGWYNPMPRHGSCCCCMSHAPCPSGAPSPNEEERQGDPSPWCVSSTLIDACVRHCAIHPDFSKTLRNHWSDDSGIKQDHCK